MLILAPRSGRPGTLILEGKQTTNMCVEYQVVLSATKDKEVPREQRICGFCSFLRPTQDKGHRSHSMYTGRRKGGRRKEGKKKRGRNRKEEREVFDGYFYTQFP